MPRSLTAGLRNALRNLRYNYLVFPGSIALSLAGLAFGLAELDRRAGAEGVLALFPAGPSGARAVCATIATAVATVAGVSFSITIISLQLVSQQFTPRALRGFLGDRINQTVAGVFLGVFVYALVALRAVEDAPQPFVPGLTVTSAIVLAGIALALLLVFIHHMGHSIQVSNIAKGIGEATVAAAGERYPSSYGEPVDADPDALVSRWEKESEPVVVYPAESGFVQSVDDLPRAIRGDSFWVELFVAPGDFVTQRHPIGRVWATEERDGCARALRRAIAVSAERDLAHDVGYGVRQLADIAVKALSPSVNDPTTATTCIGYLQAILERVAARPEPCAVRRYAERNITIVMRRDTFPDLIEALIQISRYATSDARAVDALLRACLRIAQAAAETARADHARTATGVAARIARRALGSGAIDEEEREAIQAALARVRATAGTDL